MILKGLFQAKRLYDSLHSKREGSYFPLPLSETCLLQSSFLADTLTGKEYSHCFWNSSTCWPDYHVKLGWENMEMLCLKQVRPLL